MNKKKLTALVASLGLVACIGVGATLAYFTDSEKTQNTVTMGNVNISLTEPNFDKNDGETDNIVSHIVPGKTIAKDPTITLMDNSEPAYVRMKVEYKLDGNKLTADEVYDLEKGMDINRKLWNQVGDYWYYNPILTKDNNTATLFSHVTIPSHWSNDYTNKNLTIDITAEAIQAENFEPKTFDGGIVSWQDENGKDITVDTYDGPVALN